MPPTPEQRVGDRDLGLLGELPELVPRPECRMPCPARITGRFARAISAAASRSWLGLPRTWGGSPAAPEPPPRRVARPRLRLERVLGDVDVDRARAAGPGDVERLGDHPRDVVGVANEVVVLVIGSVIPVMSISWNASLPIRAPGHVAGDRHDGHASRAGSADPGDQVGGARAPGAEADADLAGGAGIAVGRVGAALLMADEDVAQLGSAETS